jgi:hypothetical protein
MRYSPSDKTEIIRLVEQSPWRLDGRWKSSGIPRSSFHRWYDRYQGGGPEALAGRNHLTTDSFSGPDFCLIFAPCGYDDPEILRTRKPPAVSKALTADKRVRSRTAIKSGSSEAGGR